eukprot:114037_1
MANTFKAPLLSDADKEPIAMSTLSKALSPTLGGHTKTHDFLFKVILVGDSAVGKSSILHKYVDNQDTDLYLQTIGVDFKIKTIFIEDNAVKLQIWDTTGQERFRSITTSYYKGSNIFLVVFDITDRKSFTNVERHLHQINQHANHGNLYGMMLIGNKCDLKNDRVIDAEEAQQIANQSNVQYLEVSAKTGERLDSMFQCAAKNAVLKKKALDIICKEEKRTYTMSSTPSSSGSSTCCCTVL